MTDVMSIDHNIITHKNGDCFPQKTIKYYDGSVEVILSMKTIDTRVKKYPDGRCDELSYNKEGKLHGMCIWRSNKGIIDRQYYYVDGVPHHFSFTPMNGYAPSCPVKI